MAEPGAALVGLGRAESGGGADGAGADPLLPQEENGVDGRAIRVGTRRSQVGSGRIGVRGVPAGAEERPQLPQFACFDSCRGIPGRSLESPSFGTQGTVCSVIAVVVQGPWATARVSRI